MAQEAEGESERVYDQGAGMTTTLSIDDAPRLARQLALVLATSKRREWLTLDEYAALIMDGYGVKCSTPSVSARLRQLRSQGYTVSRRKLAPGLFAYSVKRMEPVQTDLRDIL